MMMTGEKPHTNVTSDLPAAIPAGAVLAPAPLSRALGAIFWKEFRRNWTYGALGLIVWIAAFVTMFGIIGRAELRGDFLNYLGQPGVRILSYIAVCGMALWLGIGSTFRERDFDMWAFLVHRPVARSWLFAGRLAAGLAVYLLGAGLPLAVLILVAMTRAGGEFFYWRMALPTLAVFLAGLNFYVAGFLVGDRQARFFGSRIMPAACAGAAAMTAALPAFEWVLIGHLAGLALLVPACWGSAVSHGYQLRRPAPLVTRLALRGTLLASFMALLAAVTQPGRAKLNQTEGAAVSDLYSNDTSLNFQSRGFLLTNDATLLEEVRDFHDHNLTRTWTDEQGRPAAAAATQPANFPMWIHVYREYSYDPGPWWDAELPVQKYSAFFWIHSTNSLLENWYLPRDGRAYGYDAVTGKLVGVLGKSGFSPAGSPLPAPFDLSRQVSDDSGFAFPEGIYQLDFTQHEVRQTWRTPPGETLLAASNPSFETVDKKHMTWRIETTDQHIFVSIEGGPSVVLPNPDPPAAANRRVAYAAAANEWVLGDDGPFIQDGGVSHMRRTYRFYDAAGKLLRTREVVSDRSANTYHMPLPAQAGVWATERGVLLGTVAPVLAAVPAVRMASSGVYWHLGVYDDATLAPVAQRVVLAVWILAGISAVLTLALAFAYRVRWKWAWALAGAALGPGVALTLMATNTWPARREPSTASRTATDLFPDQPAGAA